MKTSAKLRCAAILAALGVLVPGASRAANTGTSGSSQPIDTMQPSLALTVLIAKDGVFSGPESGGVEAGGETMVGEIRLFAGNFVPGGFLAADGSLVPISSAIPLFALIGTTYGGDGVSNFRVPDLRGRAIAGMGQGPGLTPRALGASFGSESETQSKAQLAVHLHSVAGGSTGISGSSQGLPTIQPTLAVHPIICPNGDFSYMPEIRLFAANFQPGSWMSCDGRQLSLDEYSALYTHLGTIYGGDGLSVFSLPNLQGQVAIGSGAGTGLSGHVTGETLGSEAVFLSSSGLPSHTHTVTSGSTGSAGSGTAFENHQPTLTMRYMIAVTGVMPSPGAGNPTSMPNIGEIRPWATDAPPSGWMFADGQVLPIAPNQGLFFIIGTTFGGNGVTTFALPDLRGRTPIGTGQGPGLTNRSWGDRMGSDATTLSVPQMAAHAHVLDPNGLRHPGEPSGGGAILRVKKNTSDPSKIDLSWGTGCSSGVTGYAVYQGIVGSFTSHALFAGACDVAATSLSAQTPCAGNCYYLVSTIDDLVGEEGSLGRRSSGAEIPRPASPCAAAVDLAVCN